MPRLVSASISCRIVAGLITTPARHHVLDLRRQDAARDVVQLELVAAHHDRVARIGPTQKPDHDLEARRQQVYDLPFGLITPLQTDDASNWHRLALP